MVTRLNLVVIRVADLERSAQLYQSLGLALIKEHHGGGPEHYSANVHGTILELYPRRSESEQTSQVRLGFCVESLDKVLDSIQKSGGRVLSTARDSPWGRRAVIEDLDGHRIEITGER
jgi:lactoylglutathione lyase